MTPNEIGWMLVQRITSKYPNSQNQVRSNGNSIISCPWHRPDKKPSLSVEMNTGRFKCWSCAKEGNAWHYFREIENLEDKEIMDLIGQSVSSIDYQEVKKQEKFESRRITSSKLPRNEARYDYHDENQSLVFTVLRNAIIGTETEPKRKYTPFHLADDNKLWICGMPQKRMEGFPVYNFPQILAKPEATILVSEGEKCARAVEIRLCKDNQVSTCWHGGVGRVKQYDWSWAKNRRIVLLADADESGHNCMVELAENLHKLGAKSVHIMLPFINDYTRKSDIYDYLEKFTLKRVREIINSHCFRYPLNQNKEVIENPKAIGSIQDLINYRLEKGTIKRDDFFLGKIKSKRIRDEKEEEEEEEKEVAKETSLYLNRALNLINNQKYFTIIGKGDENTALIRKNVSNDLIEYSMTSFSPAKLLQLHPDPDFWRLSNPNPNPNPKFKSSPGIKAYQVQFLHSAICKQAEFFGRVRTDLLRGRGAEIDHKENLIVFNTGEYLIINGKNYPLDGGEVKSKLKNIYISGMPLRPYKRPLKTWEQDALKLGDLMEQFPFRDELSRITFFGWLGTVMLSGALPWRTNPWIVAKSNSGKSWLFNNIIMKIFSDNDVTPLGDFTKAFVARKTGLDSIPLFTDELKTEQIETSILDILRMTSSGSLARGTAESGAGGGFSLVTMKPRASFYISSTQKPRLKEESANRIRLFHFKQKKLPEEEFGEIEENIDNLLTPEVCESIRNGLLLNGQRMYADILEASKKCVVRGKGTRQSFQAAAFYIGSKFFLGEDETRLRIIYDDIKENTLDDDPTTLLKRIFEIPIEDYDHEDAHHRRTRKLFVSWLCDVNEKNRSRPEQLGFKYYRSKQIEYGIVPTYQLTFADTNGMRELGKRLDMEAVDIFSIIRQLPRVRRAKQRVRFNSKLTAAYTIPRETIEEMGYRITDNGMIDTMQKGDTYE